MEFLAGLHPKIIHFPVAFLIIYVLLEITGIIFNKEFFTKAAYLFLFLGVLGLVAAVLTGNQAEAVANQWEEKGAIIPFNAIGEHEQFASNTLWFFTALLVFRTFLVLKKKFTGFFKYLIIVLALVGAFLVYETAEHGGKLVYKYGVGTDLKKMEIEE